MCSLALIPNVHDGLPEPGCDVTLVKGKYDYYHYNCDGINDTGWGCGYRTMQTMCSWIAYQRQQKSESPAGGVPSIRDIQDALVQMKDKPHSFANSREWLGSFEISICIDHFYDVPCKLVHVPSGSLLQSHIDTLTAHFESFGSPVMMGGDSDNASKCIVGVCREPDSLLVVDPHHTGSVNISKDLHNNGMVAWRPVKSFLEHSFYNFCLPQMKADICILK